MSTLKKSSVKWNIVDASESVRSSTPWSSYSYGESNSSGRLYTESFEEPTQSQRYSDDFVSDSHETYSDTFISSTVLSTERQATSTNGTSAVVSENITAFSYSDKDIHPSSGVDTVQSVTENVDTVIEAHPSIGIETQISESIKPTIDTQVSEAIETVIDTHISEAVETLAETAYDSSESQSLDSYSDTFETSSHHTGADSEYDTYSEPGSYTDSYHSDSYTQSHTVSGATASEYSEDRESRSRSYEQSYTQSHNPETTYIEIRDHTIRDSCEEFDSYDEYSDTFEPTELTSQVYLVDPEEIRREEELQRETEEAHKKFVNNLVLKLRHPPSKKKTVTISLPKEKEKIDKHTESYCQRKLKLLRTKRKSGKELSKDSVNGPHPLLNRGTHLSQYGISESVLERAKMTSILSAMEQAANTKIHEPKNCPECREEKARLDAKEAKRLFIRSRGKALENKMMDARVEDHILKMNSVLMIAEIARELPRASEKPEKIMDKLFEPLLGKNVMR